MKNFVSFKLITLSVAALAIVGTASAKTEATKSKPDPMQEAWMKASTPGESHQLLDRFVGRWKVTTKWWMNGPKAAPTESKGTAKTSWELGKRFLKEEFEGDWEGKDFEGIGYVGYDNSAKRFVSTWTDTMSTSIMYQTGKMDKAGKVLTMRGTSTDPMGKRVQMRSVTKILSDDEHTFELFQTEEGKAEVKLGEMTYTRRGKKRG